MQARSEGQRGLHDALRQLALGLSTYRLFPDDPDQPAYHAAVDRIREAVSRALQAGSTDAEVRRGVFRDVTGTELTDEHTDRLASACFARNVEHLHLRAVPSARELREVFRVLSLSEDEVAERGGVGLLLQRAGVNTLRLGDVEPEGDETASHALDALTPDQLDVWSQVVDPERFAANLLVAGLGDDPATAAEDLYRRFEAARAVLPVALASSPDFVQNLIRTVRHLPASVRTEFDALAITRTSAEEALAAHYVGAMTDNELATTLAELEARGGPSAQELAGRLVRTLGRHASLVEATLAQLVVRGLVEPEEGAGPGLAAGEAARDAGRTSRDTAADLLASDLVKATSADLTAVRAEYPADEEAVRGLALGAFRDYLLSERLGERVSQTLEVWGAHLHDSLEAGDDEAAVALVAVVEDVYGPDVLDSDRDHLVRPARDRVLQPRLLHTLAERAKHEAGHEAVIAILRRFGDAAATALLDVLAGEDDRGTRAILVGLVADVVHDPAVVADRLGDERWFVVRNAVTILGRLRDGEGFRFLSPLVEHPHASVRRELVRSLVLAGGGDAAPPLRRLAADRDRSVRLAAIAALASLVSPGATAALAEVVDDDIDVDDRRRALDELRRHPDPSALERLEELAARRRRPKLPRSLRRHARACLSARKKDA